MVAVLTVKVFFSPNELCFQDFRNIVNILDDFFENESNESGLWIKSIELTEGTNFIS